MMSGSSLPSEFRVVMSGSSLPSEFRVVMSGSSLPAVVCRRAHVLLTLFVLFACA